MSGICGVVALDDRPVEHEEIRAMVRVLERRGPEGSSVWREGPVGLGHTLLATTPEAEVEKLPLTHAETGCTITADARLDNREELLEALGLQQVEGVLGDGELILLAYLKWGENCPRRFLGDFAFVIWDPREQHLFGARDHMGMRQLNFAFQPGGSFVLGTEPEAVLASGRVSSSVNDLRVFEYLLDLECLGLTSTFFEHIERLPPASSLSLKSGDLVITQYWKLDPSGELQLESDDAYAERFLDVFSKATRARLRSAKPVASMLSGGMDSSSVSAVASRALQLGNLGPLATISAIGEDPKECTETRMALLASLSAGLEPHYVELGKPETWAAQVFEHTLNLQEPFDGNMVLPRAVYARASNLGHNVVLDGASADVVLGEGSWILRLIRMGAWRKALREVRGEIDFWGSQQSVTSRYFRSLQQALAPQILRDIKQGLRPAVGRDQIEKYAYLQCGPAIVQDRLSAYASSFPKISVPYLEECAQKVTHPLMIRARERYDRVASAFSIEPRDPFLDRRVVEFCARLPGKQRMRDGWPKFILRQAMKGTLPKDLICRKGKQHLGFNFAKSLHRRYVQEYRDVAATQEAALSKYVERDVLRKAIEDIRFESSLTQNSIIYLAFWQSRN